MEDPQSLLVLTERFLAYERVRHYSPRTIEAHTKMLRRFRLFCQELGLTQARQVTRAVILNYQSYLYHHRKKDGEAMTVATQKHWLGVVKKLFSYLTREGLALYNPASDLELPRDEYRLPKAVLSHSEVEAVMNVPDIETPLGLRDRAVMEVLYSTGMRREELCNLNKGHIDFERGVVRIDQGKGRKDRYVPIGHRALLWLEKYLVEARAAFCPSINELALFVGTTGQRMTTNRLSAKVHALIEKADIGKHGSCHLFRHAFATQLLENGCDLRHIQAMMGHASIESTEIYTHVSISELKKAHDRCHPAQMPVSSSSTGS
jgi:integrase/recombinase XerD